MQPRTYWKVHYVLETDADEIERHPTRASFISCTKRFDLLSFERGKTAPNILVSQGSGDHAFVFAELGYLIYSRG